MSAQRPEDTPGPMPPRGTAPPDPAGTANKGYYPEFDGPVRDHELAQVDERRRRVHGVEPRAPDPNVPSGPLDKDLVGLAFSGGGIRSATFNLGIIQALAALKLLTRIDYLSAVSGGGYIAGWLAAWIRREPDRTRADPDGAERNEASVHNVQKQLAPSRVEQAGADRQATEPGAVRQEEPEPIHHLRAYGRYLSPRFGLFELDSWVLVGLYLRNVIANGLLFLFAAAVLALVCRLVIRFDQLPRPADALSWGALGVAAFLMLVGQLAYRWFLADVRIRGRLRAAARGGAAGAGPPPTESKRLVGLFVLAPCALAGVLLVWLCGADPALYPDGSDGYTRLPQLLRVKTNQPREYVEEVGEVLRWIGVSDDGKKVNTRGEYVAFGTGFALFGFLMFPVGNLIESARSRGSVERTWRTWWWMLAASGAFGFAFGFLFCAIRNNVILPPEVAVPSQARFAPACPAAALGVPLFLAALVVAGFVDTIICGPTLSEYEREWRGRTGAMLLRFGAVWACAFGVAVYVPWVLEQKAQAIGAAVSWAVGAGAVYVFRQKSGGAAGAPGPGVWDRFGGWVLFVVPPLLLAGLVALVSSQIQELPEIGPDGGGFMARVEGFPEGSDPFAPARYFGPVAGWLALVAVLGCAYAWLVHPNLFSLHSVYGNRLVRCYLGASRRKLRWGVPQADREPENRSPGAPTGVADTPRHGNQFTGFSPRDDFSLLWLRTDADGFPRAPEGTAEEPWKEARTAYTGPYPLFNTTLNLVAGDELAYQDRKGASFVLTPDFCGSALTGYARTVPAEGGVVLADPRALSLGRAITISGAAVDPNMRNYQSGGLTALLSLLNLRLGWWLQNPWTVAERPDRAARPWTADDPWSARYLVTEALGGTRADTDYVHLSDGGHFENTGAYELIRRRCRYVVVVDAAEDPADASENLANLIRLVRTDFGISIEIDTSPLRKDAAGLSRWHCAVGAIRYDDVDDANGMTGTLVFIRSSLTGDEPADIRNYAATHPPFPHHSTADQFFDEDQFESYRALGHHIGMAVFAGAKDAVPEPAPWGADDPAYRGFNRDFFSAVRRAWAPLPDGVAEGAIRSWRDYLRVVGELRDRTELRRLSRSLFPEAGGRPAGAGPAPCPGGTSELAPAGWSDDQLGDLHAVDYLLQTMELAWVENELEQFHAHPLNRGWMNVLRRWTTSELFHRFWPILRGQYSRGFVRFCEVSLNLSRLPTMWCRVTDPAAEPWNGILRAFDQEFYKEWASVLEQEAAEANRELPPLSPAEYLSGAVGREPNPLAWVLTVGSPGQRTGPLPSWAPGTYPLGLVVAFASGAAKDPAAERELLVWVRGPHRTLGLGRDSLPRLLDVIDAELPPEVTRLFVRYPRLGRTTQGDRVQRAMWMWFFNDNDFRRDRKGSGERPEEVRLIRDTRPPNPDRAPGNMPEPAEHRPPAAEHAPQPAPPV